MRILTVLALVLSLAWVAAAPASALPGYPAGHQPTASAVAHARAMDMRRCTLNLPQTHGTGWAQITVWQSCGKPAWVRASFQIGRAHV